MLLPFPELESPPEYSRVTTIGLELVVDAHVRLVEKIECPNCRKEFKVCWYGGNRW
jgi:hypothetical protein